MSAAVLLGLAYAVILAVVVGQLLRQAARSRARLRAERERTEALLAEARRLVLLNEDDLVVRLAFIEVEMLFLTFEEAWDLYIEGRPTQPRQPLRS